MQEHKQLAPALRRRIGAEQVPFRQLVAEFGQFVAPETAIRTFNRVKPSAADQVELTREQVLQLGRQYALAEALSRIGAKYTGPRTGMLARTYRLPEDKREVLRAPSPFIQLPTVAESLVHLRSRLPVVAEGNSKSWNLADRQSVTVLLQLAEACEKQGLTQDILDGAPPFQVIPVGDESRVPPTFTEAAQQARNWPPFLTSKHGVVGRGE